MYHIKLMFTPTFFFLLCIDHEHSNIFKESTQVLDNEGAKRNCNDLPTEGTTEQKSSVIATSPQRGTARRGPPGMCKQEACT